MFDSVYIVKSYKVKSKEQTLSLQYSRPGDAIPFSSRLYHEKGSAELTVNEYMPVASYFFQTKLKPPFVMKDLRISFIDPLFDNKSNSAQEITFSFKSGLLCQFNSTYLKSSTCSSVNYFNTFWLKGRVYWNRFVLSFYPVQNLYFWRHERL